VTQVGATAEFWYPQRGGIEALPRALGKLVDNVQLGRKVEHIDVRGRTIAFSDGERVPFDRMIYTLPLSALVVLVRDLPAPVRRACAALQYQGILCLNLGIDRAGVSDKHWVYFYEDGFPFHRLSFPANFSSSSVPAGKSSISMEIAFSEHRPIDRDTIVDEAIEALRVAGILHVDDRIELVHKVEILPAYVIYDLDHARNVTVIRSWLAEHGITLAGRFGEWQYFNMDHAMGSGRNAARDIAAERRRGRARVARRA
jgi:UDP-galactopyranose mutase